MAVYEFKCLVCTSVKEITQSIHEEKLEAPKCTCGNTMSQLFGADVRVGWTRVKDGG